MFLIRPKGMFFGSSSQFMRFPSEKHLTVSSESWKWCVSVSLLARTHHHSFYRLNLSQIFVVRIPKYIGAGDIFSSWWCVFLLSVFSESLVLFKIEWMNFRFCFPWKKIWKIPLMVLAFKRVIKRYNKLDLISAIGTNYN